MPLTAVSPWTAFGCSGVRALTRPWTMRVAEWRRPDDEMWESPCYEGNVAPDTWLLKTDTKQK
jgi:hypothetical protein